jgi:hypothetical protein
MRSLLLLQKLQAVMALQHLQTVQQAQQDWKVAGGSNQNETSPAVSAGNPLPQGNGKPNEVRAQLAPQRANSFYAPLSPNAMNNYEPFVSFIGQSPPLPPQHQMIRLPLIFHQPSFTPFGAGGSRPPPTNFLRLQTFIAPQYSTIPLSVLNNQNTTASVNASESATTGSAADGVTFTTEQPTGRGFVPTHSTPTQVSAPNIIFDSARIPEEVAISSSGGLSSNQRPLTLTPEEQRNVFTAAADSSLVIAPLVFSEDSVVGGTGSSSTLAPAPTGDESTPATEGATSSSTEANMVTRTLPGGKRIRLRKVKKNPNKGLSEKSQ